MNLARLGRLVAQSVRRSKRDFLFASIGILIGIATLLVFTALGVGIKATVLERVFMVRQLEVEAPSMALGGLFGGQRLDDAAAKRLADLPGVVAVYPKMKLTFPSGVSGGKSLLGQDLRAELIADGIPPELVRADASGALPFEDFEDQRACTDDASCPTAQRCTTDKTCAPIACDPTTGASACPAPTYCHPQEHTCLHPIPILTSPQLLELYNGSVHTALRGVQGPMSKLPKLSNEALIGLQGTAIFGRSYFLGGAASGAALTRKIQLVGFSEQAQPLGATMPITVVQRLNRRFSADPEQLPDYHAILVETASNEVAASVAQQIKEELKLALSDRYEDAQRASLLIVLVTLVFNLISLVILAVAAVNIMHTFLMLILERRREFGLMRALGATRGHIRALILCEATLLGLFGATAGVITGALATLVIDAAFQRMVRQFPFKPESLFLIEPWMIAACFGAALTFCWIGALLPALRAGSQDPARALTGG